jgi:zinc transport system substrate-binding protein
MKDSSLKAGRPVSKRSSYGGASRALFALLLPLLFLLSFQGCAVREDSGMLRVVASMEPLAWFVDRIGGDRVSVSVMVPAGADPHSYEPTPRQMAGLASSALFVKAGSGVEFELNWIPRMLELNRGLRIADASAGVRLLPMQEDGHDQGRLDPHFWLSPANARLIASNVRQALAAADPESRDYYEANYLRLDGELRALSAELAGRLAPVRQRRFIVFHPAWGYFAHEFGLEQVAIEREGKSLTPQQMAGVIETAKREGIRTVFISPQFSSVQAGVIARDIGGVTAPIDPLARNYADNLRRAVAAFTEAMR